MIGFSEAYSGHAHLIDKNKGDIAGRDASKVDGEQEDEEENKGNAVLHRPRGRKSKY